MKVDFRPGERWYGGIVHRGWAMPFRLGFSGDFGASAPNQVVPLLLSSEGRWVWSERPFAFEIRRDGVTIAAEPGAVELGEGEAPTLKAAYLEAARRFFSPSGRLPDPLLFTRPQFNSWIELGTRQSEEAILAYAEAIVGEGYEPGVLMIDDGWQAYTGGWRFRADRFGDPKGMIDRLHGLGFKVMLWVVPYVSPDSPEFRDLKRRGFLVRAADGSCAVRSWWNGASALLDLTHPGALGWLKENLDALAADFGVDGFKFDGGEAALHRDDDRTHASGPPVEQTAAFARLGSSYPLNEFRACWRMGGQPLAQRLHDKLHTWDEDGLGGCIPNCLAQGLAGHAFCCPDLIGGGERDHFWSRRDSLDPELFVRHAQVSALMPMMQFSAAPWRVLPAEPRRLCLEASRLHGSFAARILDLARASAATGEPIVRHLEYEFPHCGLAEVNDQFLLGPGVLVAPVTAPGARSRRVHFPPGSWRAGEGGETIDGPAVREVPASLGRLPWFELAK